MLLVAGALLSVAGGPFATVSSAQQAPVCQVNQDFASIVSSVGASTVGDCVGDEVAGGGTGDRFQSTTRGLLIFSGAGNWTASTDGQTTWISNTNGLMVAGGGKTPAQHAPGQLNPSPANGPQA